MSKVFILLLLSLISFDLYGQCPTGNLELNAQSQVDDFLVNYPNCTQISGDLLMQYADLDCALFGLCETDIDDLTPLSNITEVTGKVVLKGNILLSTLAGLQNITELESFHVYENDILSHLNDSPQSNSLDELRIYDNLILDDILGVIGLNTINNQLWIYDNPQLSECDIQPICSYLNGSGTSDIHDNNTGCNSETEIENECNVPMPCLPSGITFVSQAEIDAFPTNYPGCTEIGGLVQIGTYPSGDIADLTGLANITAFGANLRINYNPNLLSLNGLDNVTSIGGWMQISSNDALTNISALNNIVSLPEYLLIENNDVLTDLTGLGNLTSVGEHLRIYNNDGLNDLTGLDNLTSIGEWIQIQSNDGLTDLTGLGNLTSIGGYLNISYNDALYDLTGLDNPTSIGGNVSISNNNGLTDISALNNINSILGYLSIRNNNGLTDISGLANLTSIGGYLTIDNNPLFTNLIGLGNLTSVGGNLDIQDNVALNDLTGLNNLTTIGGYLNLLNNDALTDISSLSNVTSIPGYLTIWGNGLTDLTGLDNLTSIGGGLQLAYNDALNDLTSLANLISIGGFLRINVNGGLTDLTGLENLTSIGGYLDIQVNDVLLDLNGLTNLTSIGGYLNIVNNSNLTSLSGLDNIDHNTITNLLIQDNSSLSICEITSVCDYLSTPTNPSNILNNSNNCNSASEVETACAALPVIYSEDLRAQLQDQAIEITFSIAQQINNSHFEIQHSSNGQSFQYIAQIEGEGNSSQEIDYKYIHNTPSKGLNYYRIKQVDLDGQFSYSNITSVNFEESEDIKIFPIPATTSLNVITVETVAYVIQDLSGRLIIKGDTQNSNSIDISMLDKGIYLIKLSNGFAEKIIKI